jgi:hypothetical protein
MATEEQLSVVHFVWAKGLNAKDIHKETFPVYGGKCLSCKVVHNWVEKFSQGRSKVAYDIRPGAKMYETTNKKYAQIKRWDKCIDVGRGYVEK